MKKLTLSLTTLLCLSFGYCMAQPPTGGSPVDGIAFTYDAGGRRVLREVGIVCLGCKQTPKDSLIKGTPIRAIKNGDKIELVAYPNPTSNDLYISNQSWKLSDKAVVEVFDMHGRSILKKDFSQATDMVSLAQYAPGNYMVYYYLNQQPAQVWKVIKL